LEIPKVVRKLGNYGNRKGVYFPYYLLIMHDFQISHCLLQDDFVALY